MSDRLEFAEPGIRPHYAPSRGVFIEHMNLTLRVDPREQQFEGHSVLRLDWKVGYDGPIVLDLGEVELTKVAGPDGDLEFRHADGELHVFGRVDVLELAWKGTKPAAGLYFIEPNDADPDRGYSAWTQCQDEDGHHFFPCLDHPRFKHAWSITVECPEAYQAVSNGRFKGEELDNGWRTTHWEQVTAMPAYLFTMVVAELDVVDDAWGDLSVRYLVPPGATEPIERSFGRTPEMIELFSQITGTTYPWARYDQVVVHDFVFGGMENTACTLMTDILLVDAATVPHWDPEGLVSHELAHQWFGDLVTCRDWAQGWLNESFATFMETVWMDHALEAHEAEWYAFEQARGYFGEDASRYRRAIQSYMFREPIDVFDRHLYEKGSVVLRTLRTELGSDAFWESVRVYLDRHAYGSVTGRQLQNAFEDTTGRNLDAFFKQWWHSPGHPELTVSMKHEDGFVELQVTQTQSGGGVPEVYELPLHVEVVSGDSVAPYTLRLDRRERTWMLPADKLDSVRVDAGFGVLAKITLEGPSDWLRTLLDDPSPVLVSRAAAALIKAGKVDWVAEALTDHSLWTVRAELAAQLGKTRRPDVLPTLAAELGTETDPRVRVKLAAALGALRMPEATDALIARLAAGETDPHVVAACIAAVGVSRDPRTLEIVDRFGDEDSWADTIRQKSAAALGACRQPEALDHLISLLSEPLSERHLSAVGRAVGAAGAHLEDKERVVDALRESFGRATFRARIGILGGFANLKSPLALGFLNRIHQTEPDGRLRRLSYEAKVRTERAMKAPLDDVRRRLDTLESAERDMRAVLDRVEGRR